MYLVKISNKLFYKKYLYALELHTPFYAIFRNKNLDCVKKYIDILNMGYYKGRKSPFKSSEVDGLPLWLCDRLKQNFIPHYKFKVAYEIYNYLLENDNCTIRVEYPGTDLFIISWNTSATWVLNSNFDSLDFSDINNSSFLIFFISTIK